MNFDIKTIKIGDKFETIRSFTEAKKAWPAYTYPEVGDVVTLKAVEYSRTYDTVLFHFEEHPNHPTGYDSRAFKPITQHFYSLN